MCIQREKAQAQDLKFTCNYVNIFDDRQEGTHQTSNEDWWDNMK
jgi:hypothetical protein